MNMRTIAIGVCLTLACGSLAVAKDQEKPGKALKRGFKELRKLKSYRVDFSVQGGTAVGATHTFKNTVVNETWSANVRGKVDNLNGGVAFRLRPGGKGGAIQDSGNWKALLATDKGRLIERLFKRPEIALREALRHSKRGKWLAPEGSASSPAPRVAEKKAEADDAGTQSRDENTGPGSVNESVALSHVMVIEAPAQEAVKHFNRIIASGCFSEG
ncbi:MAG: hypothetical protein JKY65_03560 [Planctomycetes bacterium]|nr:hypothetical protein [Planctomycetota bacterium]